MSGCIFCEIAAGRVPSYPIWEDERHLAFLDIFPAVRGQALVIPRAHVPSYVFRMEVEDYRALMEAARAVALRVDERLGALRTCMVMEGMEVDHAHIKLYPIHEVECAVAEGTVDLNRYPGYLSTKHGARATPESLQEVQSRLAGPRLA